MNISPIKLFTSLKQRQNSKQKTNTRKNPKGINKTDESLYNSPCAYYAKCELVRNLNNYALFNEFKFKKGKVTKDEYFNLTSKSSDAIKMANAFLSTEMNVHHLGFTPKELAEVSKACKRHLNNKYGKDSYKLVSIGTSPSMITEVLGAIGEDVAFIPGSSVNYFHYYFDNLSKVDFRNFQNLKVFADYMLKEITDKNGKQDKKIVLLDFCNSGASLKFAESLAKEYCKIPEDKLYSENLENLITSACEEKNIPHSVYKKIIAEIVSQNVENYSNTPHFNIVNDRKNMKSNNSVFSYSKSEDVIFHEFEDFSIPRARVFMLLTLDEIINSNKQTKK